MAAVAACVFDNAAGRYLHSQGKSTTVRPTDLMDVRSSQYITCQGYETTQCKSSVLLRNLQYFALRRQLRMIVVIGQVRGPTDEQKQH